MQWEAVFAPESCAQMLDAVNQYRIVVFRYQSADYA
jgi:hypothetical protein